MKLQSNYYGNSIESRVSIAGSICFCMLKINGNSLLLLFVCLYNDIDVSLYTCILRFRIFCHVIVSMQ